MCMTLLQTCFSPPVHLIGQNDLISATDSLCGRNGGAIAGTADITVQPLKLNVLNLSQSVSVKPRICQYV